MGMSPKLLRPRTAAPPVTYHEEALAWKTAAEANGGTVETSTLAAVSDFCTAIDAAGIRDRFLRLNLLCGTNLAAARTPLYRGASLAGTQYGDAADVNNGPFVSGDYGTTTGLNGNGSTKYLDTGLDLPTCYTFGMEYDNVHLMACRPEAIAENFFGSPVGGYTPDYYGLLMEQSNIETKLYSGDYQGDYVVNASSASAAGMYLCQIGGTPADGEILKNNASIKSGQTFNGGTSLNDISTNVLVFANDDGDGGINNALAARLSAYSLGKAFTSSGQRTAFYNAMAAFQTAIGRSL